MYETSIGRVSVIELAFGRIAATVTDGDATPWPKLKSKTRS